MSVPPDFNYNYYLLHHPDLKAAGLRTREDAVNHFLTYGRNEGRIYNRKMFKESKTNLIFPMTFQPIMEQRTNIIVPQFIKKPANIHYPIKLAIACLFRDSAFYLKEWLEFHRLLGVEKFYLCNHMSIDNYDSILEPYIKNGLVELTHETKGFSNSQEFESTIHAPFYQTIVEKTKNEVEWLALIDSDEFIVPVKDESIPQFLSRHSGKVAICMNWQLYGTSGIVKIPENKLFLECLVHRAVKNAPEHRDIKTIVRPQYVKNISSPHNPILLDGYVLQLTSGEVVKGATANSIVIDEIRLNHYNTGDINYFETIKVPFYKIYCPGRTDVIERAKRGIWNDEEDFVMKKWISQLRSIIFK